MRYNRVYLDIDDVLGDFGGAVLSAFNLSPELRDEIKCWDGHSQTLSLLLKREITTFDMWERIKELEHSFWSDMPLLPWAHDLFEICKENCKEVVLMTNPVNPAQLFSAGGKLKWIEKNFPDVDGFILTDLKSLVAFPGSLLIDDNEEWCQDFATKGDSYCFPRSSNCTDWLERDPLKEIESILTSVRFSI